MARNVEWQNTCQTTFTVLFLLFISITSTEQLEQSQVRTLLKVRQVLGFPPFMNSWNKATDFCNSEPSSNITVVCYEENITQLHIVGEIWAPRLPENFSIDSFVNTLARIPYLKVLRLVSLGLWGPFPGEFTKLSSLELLNLTSNFFRGSILPRITSMTRLQSLILDGNNLTGQMPEGMDSLSSLVVMSVRNNSFNGFLPHSLGNLANLRILALSNNKFSGEVPDLSRLTNLQELDLENNALGPQFPVVCENIESIVLKNNKFTFGIPEKVQSYHQLKILTISLNRFVGPFPVSLLSLPHLTSLDIAQNKFTGMLTENLPCSDELVFVNFTANMLTGKLPSCLLSGSKARVVLYTKNCLATGDGTQNPISLCKNEALAVGIPPHSQKRNQTSKVILALGISGGVVGTAILAGVAFLAVRKFHAKIAEQKSPPRFISENVSAVYTSKLLKDARYITQAMKVGALGLPSYRTFSLEELEEATKNFDTSSFMGEGTRGQVLAFGFRQCQSWAQRIAAATGIAKGIQFLHTGIMLGVFSNNLSMIKRVRKVGIQHKKRYHKNIVGHLD